jgi:hypothetical protein
MEEEKKYLTETEFMTVECIRLFQYRNSLMHSN